MLQSAAEQDLARFDVMLQSGFIFAKAGAGVEIHSMEFEDGDRDSILVVGGAYRLQFAVIRGHCG
jgi:hypothetical protein